jgi:glycosyltransferase involved in cell wall biosynthesis
MTKKKQIVPIFEPIRAVYRRATVLIIQKLLRNAQKQSAMMPMAYRPIPNRLLYVAASSLPYHVSGYTTRTHAVQKALRTSGLDVITMTRPGYPWDRSDRLVANSLHETWVDDIAYQHIQFPSHHRPVALYVWQASRQIMKFAIDHQVGGIQAASNHVNALPALIAAKTLGIPFFYEMRGLWELTRASRVSGFGHSQGYQQGLELEGLVASYADKVYVISDQLKQFAINQWGINPEKMASLPNCISPDDFPELEEKIKASVGVSKTIGYAGSLMDYEGLDILLDAIAILHRQEAKVNLRIVGGGECLASLQNQAQTLQIESCVQFYGRVSPEVARELILISDLVCLPRKPYAVCEIIPPIKLVEAMAMGKPVIVPNLPVFQDELNVNSHKDSNASSIQSQESNETDAAWFFESGNAADLAKVISMAFSDEAVLKSKSTRARRYALQNRNWQNYVDDVGRTLSMGGK